MLDTEARDRIIVALDCGYDEAMALSEALTPRAGMVQRREASSSCMALPWPGGVMLVMTKSAVTTSWITMLVAPSWKCWRPDRRTAAPGRRRPQFFRKY